MLSVNRFPKHRDIFFLELNTTAEEYWWETQIVHSTNFIKSILRDFLHGPVVENLPANAGGMGLIPGPGGFHMLQSN